MITIYFGPKVAFEKIIPNNSKKIHGLMDKVIKKEILFI